MKKTIVVIILVVYIASIAVVNFFGLEIKQFDQVHYVNSILCDSVTLRRENGGELSPGTDIYRTFTFEFIPSEEGYTADPESLAYNPNAVEINYRVVPDFADNKEVRLSMDSQYETFAYFDASKKTVVFLDTGMVCIKIDSLGSANVSTFVYIRARISNAQ